MFSQYKKMILLWHVLSNYYVQIFPSNSKFLLFFRSYDCTVLVVLRVKSFYQFHYLHNTQTSYVIQPIRLCTHQNTVFATLFYSTIHQNHSINTYNYLLHLQYTFLPLKMMFLSKKKIFWISTYLLHSIAGRQVSSQSLASEVAFI